MDFSEYFKQLKTRDITVLYDGDNTKQVLQKYGFHDLCSFSRYDESKEGVCFALLEDYASLQTLKKWWDNAHSLMSHTALAKFDTCYASIDYTLQQMLAIDPKHIMERRQKFYQWFETKDVIRLLTPVGALDVHVGESIEVANRDHVLKKGWVYSFAEWFEASLVNIQGPTSSFSLSGSTSFSGFIYLCNNPELKEKVSILNDLQRKASTSKDNWISFEDACISDVVIDGKSYFDVFQELYNKERKLCPTEFAFGCVEHKKIDWSINSLINESSYGFHVGIGMGKETPHLDFICPFGYGMATEPTF